MSTPNCPICGHPLAEAPMLSSNFIPVGKDNPIVKYFCKNPDCHGWYDEYCQEWRSFGMCCAVCMVRNMRSDTNYQEDDFRGVELYQKLHNQSTGKQE